MGRQLSQFLKTMGAASGVAPAPVTVPAMTGGSFQRRLNSGGLDSTGQHRKLGQLWRLGFGWQRHWVKVLFIGGRVWHREFEF
jgi:hypothetical protein